MICAACGETTGRGPCDRCGEAPWVGGRYTLDELLGRGVVATTWRATRNDDGRVVALKELPLSPADPAKARELVEREGRVLRQLHHPNIPAWIEQFVVRTGRQSVLYVAREFVDGVTLADELVARRYNEDDVLAIVEELCGILVYLHGLCPPVLHRDIKPGNVMRRTDGTLVLIDFGSVRDACPEGLGTTVAGTFGYMAPEQFVGEAFPATDIYGVGALAVALLARCEPRTLLDYSGRLSWDKRVSLHPTVTSLLKDMTATDPSDRIPTAAAALTRVRQVRLDRLRPPVLAPMAMSPRPTTQASLPRNVPPHALRSPPSADGAAALESVTHHAVVAYSMWAVMTVFGMATGGIAVLALFATAILLVLPLLLL